MGIWLDTGNTARLVEVLKGKADKIWIIDYGHQLRFCFIIQGKSGHKYMML